MLGKAKIGANFRSLISNLVKNWVLEGQILVSRTKMIKILVLKKSKFVKILFFHVKIVNFLVKNRIVLVITIEKDYQIQHHFNASDSWFNLISYRIKSSI